MTYYGKTIFTLHTKGEPPMFSGIFQPMHLIVILGIVLIIFGPGKLPELGEGLAKGIKSFKAGIKDLKDETKDANVAQLEGKEEKKTA